MRIIIVFICLTLLGCSSGQTNSDKKTDSTTYVAKGDTADFVQESIADLRKEFVSLYSKPISIDTFYIDNDIKYRVLFTHASSNDSGLLIPAIYNFDTHTNFTTHNFISKLTLLLDTDTLFHTNISKSLFDKRLDNSLRQYATLLYPHLSITNDTIKLHYSISIPVTDVGVGVTIKYAKDGSYMIED